MCLIVVKPFDKIVPRSHIEEAILTNPHGVGVSFQLKGFDGNVEPVESRKWAMPITVGIIDEVMKYLENPMYQTVFHTRLATHGSKSIDNVHPFKSVHGGYLHHNGVISKGIDIKGDKTDSETFMNQVFDVISYPKKEKQYIESFIGSYNKLAFQDEAGVTIFNEEAGHWNDGCWYSNSCYKPVAYGGWPTSNSNFRTTQNRLNDFDDLLWTLSPYEHGKNNGLYWEIVDKIGQLLGVEYIDAYPGSMNKKQPTYKTDKDGVLTVIPPMNKLDVYDGAFEDYLTFLDVHELQDNSENYALYLEMIGETMNEYDEMDDNDVTSPFHVSDTPKASDFEDLDQDLSICYSMPEETERVILPASEVKEAIASMNKPQKENKGRYRSAQDLKRGSKRGKSTDNASHKVEA